jgi:hypothetical protein
LEDLQQSIIRHLKAHPEKNTFLQIQNAVSVPTDELAGCLHALVKSGKLRDIDEPQKLDTVTRNEITFSLNRNYRGEL